ncbi:hypothetical protein SK128_012068 [Halocaridina rubra]|uniref:Uncharacterized protein n=1 Tax=Halocaridina rubra TaxID=373956 RepID=A0AAN8WQF6_HALRR
MGGCQVYFFLALALFGRTRSGDPYETSKNETEVESEFVVDILERWLRNFGTYTFVVDQDTDDQVNEDMVPETASSFPSGNDEEHDEDYEHGSSAPISLIVEDVVGLLDPDLDYTVKLESLVVEGGSVLVTLTSFENKTDCGLGGFTLSSEDRQRSGQEGRLNISHRQDGNSSTTFVAFSVDNEAEAPSQWQSGNESSSWEELSQNLWWASGKLEGGGIVSLTFTPPECGCVMLKAHYAMPVGDNLTLVVGPEAYPSDLETLLCIDPTFADIEENLIDSEGDEESAEESTNLQEVKNKSSLGESAGKVGKGRGGWATRQAAKKARRAKRRQAARQAIRQTGKRVTRKRINKHLRLRRKHDEADENAENRNGRQRGKWARKQARKAAKKQAKQAKNSWRRQRKQRRNKHRRRNRPQNATEDASESIGDNTNVTVPVSDEDAVADLLLNDEEEGDEEETGDGGTNSGSVPSHRRGRKHRRRGRKPKAKPLNREQRKGDKFCCKRGIKFKKSQFSNDTAAGGEQPEIVCSDINDIIISFAEHQFGIDKSQCAARFEACCTKFSPQFWERVRSKKAARKAKRKQQREFRHQRRRHQRERSSTSTTTSVTQ